MVCCSVSGVFIVFDRMLFMIVFIRLESVIKFLVMLNLLVIRVDWVWWVLKNLSRVINDKVLGI